MEFVLLSAPLLGMFILGIYLGATSLAQTVALNQLVLENRKLGLADVEPGVFCKTLRLANAVSQGISPESFLKQQKNCGEGQSIGLRAGFSVPVFPEFQSEFGLLTNQELR